MLEEQELTEIDGGPGGSLGDNLVIPASNCRLHSESLLKLRTASLYSSVEASASHLRHLR